MLGVDLPPGRGVWREESLGSHSISITTRETKRTPESEKAVTCSIFMILNGKL